MNAPLPVFLTAYDPAELPGGTVDPLGFTAGYLALADLLFPGMTAAAAQATYLPMLCAGLTIAQAEGGLGALSATAARKRRIDVALRFERLWALAAALQGPTQSPDDEAEATPPGESKTAGLRGITYVARQAERLTQAGAKETASEFALLAQQYRYGAFGIYGGVAEQLRLLEKSTFAPTPGFGDTIGQGFLNTTTESGQPKELIRACLDATGTVRLSTLKAWGAKAHPGAPLTGAAQKLLSEAAFQNVERARTLELVERVARKRAADDGTGSLFEACAEQATEREGAELCVALHAALAYDNFLRNFTLIFERTLWLCRKRSDAEQSAEVFRNDVIIEACGTLGERAAALLAASERLFSLGKGELRQRGRGILDIARLAHSTTDVPSLVRLVLKRHAEIQRGKFDQGRPKQAWIEECCSEFVLTSSRIGIRSGEPTAPEDVRGPDWRFGSAVSLLTVTGRLTPKAAP
ncbi:MAG TPA: hypothetical protein VIK01_11640 [Polyangiaceae bacterium]